ncbi:MAG: TonB family protein [Acidobacteria bacterium]|nr:TonB family protein [Acidobacteriota bacterium]
MSTGKALDIGAQWEGQLVEGRFRLQQYLGGTPETAVFLTQLDATKVTIKLVLAESLQPDAQLAGWRRVANLSHPNLIRILECGRSWVTGKEVLYVVTEYADENLGQILPVRALSPTEAEAMLRPTIDALSYLHRQGLVHGHLRPSNVMAVYDQLKLSSDSIQAAGASGDRSEVTIYDAPEAIGARLFPAADVWALGVTLAEALTPHSSQPKKDEAAAYWDLPQPFADIVTHCLERDPAVRWKLVDITKRLEEPVIEKIPSPTVDFAKAEEEEEEKSERPWTAFLGLGAIVLLVLAGAIYGLLHRGSIASVEDSRVPSAGAPESRSDATPAPVTNSAGLVRNQVLPNPSQSAKNTIHGRIKIRVKVAVDPSGQVSNAQFIQPGPSKYFARLAMQAAEQWKFSAPTMGGQPLASEWNLLFEFSKAGTTAEGHKIERSASRH